MTTPPLPESPVVRVRLDYTDTDGALAGSRFYLGFAGSSPSGANAAALAAGISDAWNTNIAPNIYSGIALTEVDVLDISSYSGLSGQWTGSHSGGAGGTLVPAQVAVNCEFGIGRRYRGGKPRMFFPPPDTGDVLNQARWTTAFQSGMQTAIEAFFTAIEALSIGEMGALTHVNVSYYAGFTNHTNTSGRERAVPTYRATALVEPITGYFVKQVMGSQRRRRIASTY